MECTSVCSDTCLTPVNLMPSLCMHAPSKPRSTCHVPCPECACAWQVSKPGSRAAVRDTRVHLSLVNRPGSSLFIYTCEDSARLNLDRCTVDVTAGPGGWIPHPTSALTAPPQSLIGVMLGGQTQPGAFHDPAVLTMTDCRFSMQVAAAAAAAATRAADIHMLLMYDPAQLEATRCTFSGWRLRLMSKQAAHFTDCTLQDVFGGDGTTGGVPYTIDYCESFAHKVLPCRYRWMNCLSMEHGASHLLHAAAGAWSMDDTLRLSTE